MMGTWRVLILWLIIASIPVAESQSINEWIEVGTARYDISNHVEFLDPEHKEMAELINSGNLFAGQGKNSEAIKAYH